MIITCNPRLFINFDSIDEDLQGPYQLTKLRDIFNYDPDSEDYVEGGLKRLLAAITNVILTVIPGKALSMNERQYMIKQIENSDYPSNYSLRSDHGDIYNLTTLPTYFGACLDENVERGRILFRIEFHNDIDDIPFETPSGEPQAYANPESEVSGPTADFISSKEELKKMSNHVEKHSRKREKENVAFIQQKNMRGCLKDPEDKIVVKRKISEVLSPIEQKKKKSKVWDDTGDNSRNIKIGKETCDEHWQSKYNDLVVFYLRRGHCDVPTTHTLYKWIQCQKVKFKNNKLKSDRKEAMEYLFGLK